MERERCGKSSLYGTLSGPRVHFTYNTCIAETNLKSSWQYTLPTVTSALMSTLLTLGPNMGWEWDGVRVGLPVLGRGLFMNA